MYGFESVHTIEWIESVHNRDHAVNMARPRSTLRLVIIVSGGDCFLFQVFHGEIHDKTEHRVVHDLPAVVIDLKKLANSVGKSPTLSIHFD